MVLSGLVGIGDVRHKGWVNRVTAMTLAWVVEVDDVELGLDLVGIKMMTQVVVGNLREIEELIVVDVHRKPLFYLLLDSCSRWQKGLPEPGVPSTIEARKGLTMLIQPLFHRFL